MAEEAHRLTSARPTGKVPRGDPDHGGDAKIININRAAIAKAATDPEAEAKAKFTSWKLDWMRAVRSHPLVASTDARVAETVAQHINWKTKEARLYIETIGDEINKSERTVLRSLANLRALGLIDWKRRANKASVFWLLDDKIETIAERRKTWRDISNRTREQRRQDSTS
jgi:hypothetical protein